MSNSPLTWQHCADLFSAAPIGTVRQFTRPNTCIEHGDTLDVFRLFLYGEAIATLYSDGRVTVDAKEAQRTVTTRNRLNDVLAPLGWRIVLGQRRGEWKFRTVHAPYKTMEYIDGMTLTSIFNERP